MRHFGKVPRLLLAAALFLAAAASQAAVTAGLDRDRVNLGDTLRLTITADDEEQISSTDLRPLLADFEILQRSTSSNTSIVNGKRSHIKQLLIDITPRREGTLKIPPMRVGQASTNMLLVSVGPAPDSATGGETVLFEAEVDRDSVYVQGQVILTLRVQQAINLESRSITELQIENAFVKPLEQDSFQRTMDGRPWLVHEVRYAIFPEQSGTLEIPAQTFSGRESKPRRSFFDLNSGGRQLRRQTEALSIEVLPRPDSFPATTWLPARNLVLEETWSTPPEQLRAGESATRTVRIKAEGLQGAQLPPVLFPAQEGVKYYPDQPVISESETGSGLLGVRQDSAALVPTRAGTLSIPKISIPWWDTEAGELRYATLPGREFAVAAADPGTVPAAPPVQAPLSDPGGIALATAEARGAQNTAWRGIAIVTSLGWLGTLGYLLWSRRRPQAGARAKQDNPSESRAFKQLLAACAGGNAAQARQAIIDWAAILFAKTPPRSIDQVAAQFADPSLRAELERLNAALYGRGAGQWAGTALADIVQRLRKHRSTSKEKDRVNLSLYPAAST